MTLAACFGKAALDEIQEELSDFIQTKSEGREFYRLHQAWQYVAVRMVHLNLGTVALLCGDVIGPFRAESSYLTIRQSALGEAVRRIHKKIAQIADQPFQFFSDLPRPTDWKGKGAPDLEVWAKSAASCLDECKTGNELRAACNWLMAAHGRRPTPELPHPGRYYLNSELGSVLYIADKNLGGGRRVRFVPVKNEDYYESLSFIPTATNEKSNGLELGFSVSENSSYRVQKSVWRTLRQPLPEENTAPRLSLYVVRSNRRFLHRVFRRSTNFQGVQHVRLSLFAERQFRSWTAREIEAGLRASQRYRTPIRNLQYSKHARRNGDGIYAWLCPSNLY